MGNRGCSRADTDRPKADDPGRISGANSARREGAIIRFGTRRIGGLAQAVATVTALAACHGGSAAATSVTQPGSVGVIPAAGTPSGTTGSIKYALPAGAAPSSILPVPNASNNSVRDIFSFSWQMWPPMYHTPDGSTPTVDPTLSPAGTPTWSDGGQTMTIVVKPWKWSDGRNLSSKDVLFTFDILRAAVKASPANWAPYLRGSFPDTITGMSTPNPATIVVKLSKPVNPTWMEDDILGSVAIMPSAEWSRDSANGPIIDFTNAANATKIFHFLDQQSTSVSTYATNPLWQTVDGPYKLSSFNDFTGAFTMVPNTTYSGPHATPQSDYVGVPFTSNAAEWNAILTGAVDVGYVPEGYIPQIPQLKRLGYNYYGMPAFGENVLNYNFKDKTGDFDNVVAQLYFRQAMQHLEDQAGQIMAYLDGYGAPAYGPIPTAPKSPFLPSDAAANPFPFSVTDAVDLLKANGWAVVPNGTDTCVRPGAGAGECGTGIPAGTKLAFNLIYDTTSPIPQEVEDLAANAKQAGIELSLSASSASFMIQNYNDAVSTANENAWAMEDLGGASNSAYPTQFGFLNTGGSRQIGGYSDPQADSLIGASISGSNPSAVADEASFFTTALPVLWQPVIDQIWAWKTNISATNPTAIENLTQYDCTPQFWYITG
jgi:peptide/nickel transport system substrate-binding protein